MSLDRQSPSPHPRWDILAPVYEDVIAELEATDDPRLRPFIAELAELHRRALAELDAREGEAALDAPLRRDLDAFYRDENLDERLQPVWDTEYALGLRR
jgi:hypothetical protein